MIKLPVSYKEFAKHPLMAIMYLSIVAIAYLYVDARVAAKNEKKEIKKQLERCETKNYIQDVKIEYLQEHRRKSDSAMNRLASKLETLKELGKIQ